MILAKRLGVTSGKTRLSNDVTWKKNQNITILITILNKSFQTIITNCSVRENVSTLCIQITIVRNSRRFLSCFEITVNNILRQGLRVQNKYHSKNKTHKKHLHLHIIMKTCFVLKFVLKFLKYRCSYNFNLLACLDVRNSVVEYLETLETFENRKYFS